MPLMIRGQLPIVVSSAQQITAATSSFQLDDNQNNVLAELNLTVQTPMFIPFPNPIPCTGLSLKSLTSGTLMIYPADV